MDKVNENTSTYALPLYDEEGRVVQMVPVSEAVYRAWWQEEEHARYLERRARKREVSVQALAEAEEGDALAFLEGDEGWLDSICAAEDLAPLSEVLAAALAEEPEEMREALWQLALGETTQQELAHRWGVTKSAVSHRIRRAHARLRRRLKECASETVNFSPGNSLYL